MLAALTSLLVALAEPTPEEIDRACGDSGWACDPVYEATQNRALSRSVGWLSEKPLKILAILVVAWIANRILRKVIKKAGERMASNADKLGAFMPNRLRRSEQVGRSEARAATISTITRSFATAVVVVFAAASIMSVLGVSLAAIFASAGVVGVALGFGAQNVVRDVLAGWFILIEDRYGVGDIIDAGPPATGVVERVTLRSTRLRDVNGTVWHVANGEILRVGNKSQGWARAVVDVILAPKADVDRACELLEEVTTQVCAEEAWAERIKGEPEVLGVTLMDPTGITVRTICDTEPASQFPVEREVRRRILRAFEREGIPLANVVAATRPTTDPGV